MEERKRERKKEKEKERKKDEKSQMWFDVYWAWEVGDGFRNGIILKIFFFF